MSAPAPRWVEEVRRLALGAPDGMRDRASVELHVGGFTQARVEAPVVDVSDLVDPEELCRTLAFFLVVAAASDVPVARIQGVAGARLSRAIASVRETLGDALLRMDEENAPLLRYLDVYLVPSRSLGAAATTRLVEMLARAVGASALETDEHG